MSYIAPESTIKFYTGVYLTPDQKHTIYFSSLSEQESFFAEHVHKVVSAYSYQRETATSIKVQLPASDLYNVSYMSFVNEGYSSRVWYAFVVSVEYINNVTSRVTYEIDYLQSYITRFSVRPCMVLREMTDNDTIGSNLEPESVQVGDYVYVNYGSLYDLTSLDVIIGIQESDSETTLGTLYDGIYGGIRLYCYESTDSTGIDALLSKYVTDMSSVAIMYMVPAALIDSIPEDHLLKYRSTGVQTSVQKSAIDASTALVGGYTPRNRKLYTYPYTFYKVDNANGQSLEIRYEFCYNGMPHFLITGTLTYPVSMTLRPVNYRGVEDGVSMVTNNNYDLTLSQYPMCSWNTDSYAAWTAQNSVPVLVNTAMSAAAGALKGGIGAGAVGAISGALAGAAGALIPSALSGYQAAISADQLGGSISNGCGHCVDKTQQFYGGLCSVPYQTAVTLDAYFDQYGYATNRIKAPNRTGRPHWNYVQTENCVISGNLPSDVRMLLESYHNRGLTYWANGDEIGNYNQNNTIT